MFHISKLLSPDSAGARCSPFPVFRQFLGDCQEYRPVASGEQPDIPQGFDSRQVITKDGSSVIHVVKENSQILPYCVILTL